MKNCLIVDDSSTIRKIVRGMFESFGFHCAEAENGQVAFDYCTHGKNPDLIMLDWNMPVMTGIEFIRNLSTANLPSTPPVIFCTTESQMSFIEQALGAGAVDYIIKPFEKDILRDKLVNLGLLEPVPETV